MAELAKRYPAGSLVVSTGQHPDAPDVDATFPNRVDRLPLPARRLRSIQGLLHWSRRAAVLTRQCGAEFIWCGNMKPAAYPAKWTMERLGTPFGVLLHGGDLLILQHQVHQSLLKRRTARALLSSAAVLVANSRWTRDCCLTLLGELELEPAENQVQVVPLGADHDFFRPGVDTTGVRRRYDLGEGRWLLSVARLARHKGIDTALKALSVLRDRYPDLRYAVVGSGEELEALENEAGELGVGDRVRFLTEVPDRDLPALYNCAEIYLGVSRLMEQRVEGFGISLTEASACAVPVVAGRSGGIPEAVRDGETGLLVDAERVDAVVEALQRLLDDSALRSRLGTAGRRAVETYYNWDRVAGDLARIGHQFARPVAREAVS
jgi:phosphatidylinositol alpha-1,6-mannosyltransferase